MRESAQAALSIVKNRASPLGINPARFEKSDIHVHVPAGAIPKDGPSASVAHYEDIPDEVRKAMEFVWLDTVEQAVTAPLEPAADPTLEPTALKAASDARQ